MKKTVQLILLLTMVSFSVFSQSDKSWSTISTTNLSSLTNVKQRTFPANSIYYSLNLESFRTLLLSAPQVRTVESNVIVSLPNVNGKLEKFKIWEDSNFAPELQAQYPSIRAYSGTGIDDKTASLKISIAPNGIQTMVLRADKQSEFIEPYTTDGRTYAVFNSRSRNKGELPFNCTTKEEGTLLADLNLGHRDIQSSAQILKKFRLALSCTSEYTTYFGGTVAGALAGMNATMTRVNGVYEKDLAVKLEIIPTTTNVIYTNAATDPYDNAEIGADVNNPTWNGQLQTTLSNVIGNGNYDIGHLFGASGGGGNAGCIGCVCITGKGSGFTSPGDAIPEGDTFDVDYVCHEMGHQLGANHTYSYGWEGDGAAQSVQVEVGSGSTIMGYAGVTGDYDIQSNSDDYFTYRSVLQIQTNLATKACAVNVPLTNTPPVVSAGADYTIPKGTPFVLTGTGSDTEGAVLNYTWEENDPIYSDAMANNTFASATKTTGPNFRSLPPVSVPVRYFPALSSVLRGNLSSAVESISNVGRTLKFVLTARDNAAGGGQTSSDNNVITVSAAAGPFSVTSQSVDDVSWTQGTNQTVTWTVNNTTSLEGSANVDILLSTDGGLTYPTVLATATPNDGSQDITVPNTTSQNCRLMVRPTGNVYYAINAKHFAIGFTSVTSCTTYTNTTAVAIPDGASNYSISAITVPAATIISNVNVNVNITHPYVSDLILAVANPSGTVVGLYQNACEDNANLNITFSDSGSAIVCASPTVGTFSPAQSLSAFNGGTANGIWRLFFVDAYSQDSGTLNSWSVNICSQTFTAIPLGVADFQSSNITLYPNPAKNVLNISMPDETSLPDSFVIYNSIGQTIQNTKVNSISNLSIVTSEFSNGVYFIKINKDNESKTLRFIKN